MSDIFATNSEEAFGLVIAGLAFFVSLLTLSNAARLRTGVLAMSTFAFGTGMLALSAGFFLLTLPNWIAPENTKLAYQVFFVLGFILLGFGSYQIYRMSKIK